MRREAVGSPMGAREVAIMVLDRVERDRAWAEAVLGHVLDREALPPRERALSTRLVYGCLAWRAYLDWHISRLCPEHGKRLKPEVRQLLRLGLFQILLLDKVPAYAAVSTTVNLARRKAPWAAGFVNAVLRRATREGASFELPSAADDIVRHLSVKYSHPEWMVKMWLGEPGSVGASGSGDLPAFLAANNRPAPTVLRAAGSQRGALMSELEAAGIAARPGGYSPQAVVLEGRVDLSSLSRIRGSSTVMQGEASQLIAYMLTPATASSILDACAGPGGKATHVAELAGPDSRVVAMDIRRAAAGRVAQLGRRLRMRNLETLAGDARRGGELFGCASFDRVLVDAPCSGLGTLRSHPELRWSRIPGAIAELARLQLEILSGVSPLVHPNGILLYSTCTLTRAENEGVITAFRGAHPEFRVEDPRPDLPQAARSLIAADGAFRTLPHKHGLDGFFAVRLRRCRTA